MQHAPALSGVAADCMKIKILDAGVSMRYYLNERSFILMKAEEPFF
jgi:hypothetical protein